MKRIAQILSWLALAATLALPCLFVADKLELDAVQRLMLVAALVWFVSAPFWMEHEATG